MPSSGCRYRILILGAGGVGKSAVTHRYVDNKFLDVYDPTVEDSFYKTVNRPDGSTVELEIVDTAGYDQFVGFKDIQIKEADGVVLVGSYDSLESLQMIRLLSREVARAHEESYKIPASIFVNKSDLQAREVNSNALRALQDDCQIKIMATSARLNRGVEEGFDNLIAKLVQYGPPRPTLQKKKSTSWWRKAFNKSSQ